MDPRAAKLTPPREPFDAGDPVQVKKREASAKELERRRIAGLKAMVENADCRLWLWDLLGNCGIYRSSFTGNSETFFKEGQRNVGLKVQAELVRYFPESYVTMMREGEINA